MNLVIALLSTRSYLSAEQIRANVTGYQDPPTDEAFSRMFERDKNELRDLGIPLETGRASMMDVNDGYRINRINWLEVGYQYVKLDSDIPGRENYDRNRADIGWKIQLF